MLAALNRLLSASMVVMPCQFLRSMNTSAQIGPFPEAPDFGQR
jgi:hypothetical protein